MISRASLPRLLLAAAMLVLLSACQVRLASDVGIAADGSGELAVTVALDDELWDSLATDEVDPFASLVDLTEEGWTSTVEPDGEGERLALRASFDSPEQLQQRIDELHAGLDEEDPVILSSPNLTVGDDQVSLSMQAGLLPPSSTGIEGGSIDFDGDALLRLLQERGDELFRHDLRVTMPGPIQSSDADEVEGRTATWHLPADSLRPISVTSTVGPAPRTVVVAIAVGLLALGLVGGTVAFVRRRSRP